MYAHYLSWGGRIITHFIATVFLMIGKPVFNIFNAALYCWLAYLLYRYAAVHAEKGHSLIYLAVSVLRSRKLQRREQSYIFYS